jgi:hypothetical protein
MQNADAECRCFLTQKCIYNRHLGFGQPAASAFDIWDLGFFQPAASAFDIWDRGEILRPASTFFILNIRQIEPMHLISTFLISDYFCIYILHSSFCRLFDTDQGISYTYSGYESINQTKSVFCFSHF